MVSMLISVLRREEECMGKREMLIEVPEKEGNSEAQVVG